MADNSRNPRRPRRDRRGGRGHRDAEVTADKTFVDDLDIDSLSMVEIAVQAEDKFGVKIPDDQLAELKTVGDAVDYIGDKPTQCQPGPRSGVARTTEHPKGATMTARRRRHRPRGHHPARRDLVHLGGMLAGRSGVDDDDRRVGRAVQPAGADRRAAGGVAARRAPACAGAAAGPL